MFPDWLRTLSPDDTLTQLPVAEWWAAVESMVAEATPDDIIDLTRAACGRPTPEFDMSWRGHLREHHEMSPLRGQERQIAVLAGTAVIHASESGSHRGLASYARRCARHAGWQPELRDVELTDADIAASGTDVRHLPEWPTPRRSPIAASTYAASIPGDGVPVTGDVLKAVLESLASAAADAAQRTARQVVKAAAQREERLIEQADVLSWLLAGRCADLECDWESLSPEGAATMAAAAVLDLTYFDIGRPDAASLIGQAVDAASSAQDSVDELADRQSVLDSHGFAVDGHLADLQVTCAAVYGGQSADADSIDIGIRIHDELFLQREFTGASS